MIFIKNEGNVVVVVCIDGGASIIYYLLLGPVVCGFLKDINAG